MHLYFSNQNGGQMQEKLEHQKVQHDVNGIFFDHLCSSQKSQEVN
jgi:hypothetical protein